MSDSKRYILEEFLKNNQLTIITQARVGYEMVGSQRGACHRGAITFLYPTSVDEIIVFLKTATKYKKSIIKTSYSNL